MSPESHCISLFKASTDQLNTFTESVRNLNGKLPVLVHPFYWGATHPEYPSRRNRYIKALVENRVPLLIFEEQHKIGDLRKKIGRYGVGNVYWVATQSGSSKLQKEEEDWKNLVITLKNSEVKRVLVGGMYMDVHEGDLRELLELYGEKTPKSANEAASKWLERNIFFTGCAGSIAVDLQFSGFDVAISTITVPNQSWRKSARYSLQ